MRLLNTKSLKLHFFVANIPEYVILSHTWGEEEVLFEDIDKPDVSNMAGYAKILRCCQQAREDGFEWAWIDTCCIDKRSSAELSEAINSMYKWYWEAATCYAYLADIAGPEESSARTQGGQGLERSRWFSRGWTLQELLAPEVVEFYSESWQRLGSRTKLVDQLARASNIDKRYLLDRRLISTASIATRFSWASLRQTTRSEDMAYCLLGLVGINMPMLYGEGTHAFYRLQLELIKQTNEHTMFAWQIHGSPSHSSLSTILAQSPEPFQSSANVHSIVSHKAAANMAFEMTNNGLRINLPCIPISQDRMVAILDCENGDGERLGVWLERSRNGIFHRLPSSDLSLMKPRDIEDAEFHELYIKAAPDSDRKTERKSTHVLTYGSRQTDHYLTAYVEHIAMYGDAGRTTFVADPVSGNFRNFVLTSHSISRHSRLEPPYFTVFIGWYNNTPTIRCVQGSFRAVLDSWNPDSKRLIRKMTSENANYSRDYYRAPLCCGNVVEIELRKLRQGQQICWSMEVAIEGRPSREEELDPSFRPPTTCTQAMSLDGTVKELLLE